MGLFDSLKKTVGQELKSNVAPNLTNAAKAVEKAVGGAASKLGTKRETFTFSSLPTSVEELQALPEADLSTPFKTAALTVAALCNWGVSPEDTCAMLDYLKGPQPLSTYEKQFLRDRLGGKAYKPFSFFKGAVPSNDYTPIKPYSVTVYDYAYSYGAEGYCMLQVDSGGADSPRQIKLRQKGDKWYLWEQFLLSDIRTPASEDPWA
jgi:hypothetical protein